MNQREFRQQTIIYHLLKYLGRNGYVVEHFEKIVFETEINKDSVLMSDGVKFFKEKETFFLDKNDFLKLISLKTKKLLKSYSPEFKRMRIIIFSREEYLFEYSSPPLKIL